MTAYVTITDGEIDQDSAVTQPLFTAVRDNPTAIAEGAVGAPRIVDAAMGTTATTAGCDWVLNRTALLTAGGVGTYALLHNSSTATATIVAGTTAAGSSLSYASVDPLTAATVSGTWVCLGRCQTAVNATIPQYDGRRVTVWARVS